MKYLTEFVLLTGALASVATGYPASEGLNRAVDLMLREVRADIASDRPNLGTLHVGDLAGNFSVRWHFIKMAASLHCEPGSATNLTSLSRQGDVFMAGLEMDGPAKNVSFEVRFGLEDFRIFFDKCKVKTGGVSRRGALFVLVEGASFLAQISVSSDGSPGAPCNAQLGNFFLDGAKEIQISGTGYVGEVSDRMEEIVVTKLNSSIRQLVESQLASFLRERIQAANLCDKV